MMLWKLTRLTDAFTFQTSWEEELRGCWEELLQKQWWLLLEACSTPHRSWQQGWCAWVRYGSSCYHEQHFLQARGFQHRGIRGLQRGRRVLLLQYGFRTFLDGGIFRYVRQGTEVLPLQTKWWISSLRGLLFLFQTWLIDWLIKVESGNKTCRLFFCERLNRLRILIMSGWTTDGPRHPWRDRIYLFSTLQQKVKLLGTFTWIWPFVGEVTFRTF